METFLYVPWMIWLGLASFLTYIINYDVEYEKYLRNNTHYRLTRSSTEAGTGFLIIFHTLIVVFVILSIIFTKPWWLSLATCVGAFLILKVYRGLFPYSPQKTRNGLDAFTLYFGRFIIPLFMLFAYLAIFLNKI